MLTYAITIDLSETAKNKKRSVYPYGLLLP